MMHEDAPPQAGANCPFLRALRGEALASPPIWLMRQAGRYLPEYRALRAEAPSFLDFCYTPELAAEVTLQPIRRFDFDAAILFSDILVIPDALGQSVSFVEGVGPVLGPLPSDLDALRSETVLDHLAPVLETVRRVRRQLGRDKALIGFCGAPWTVATYMIAGRGTPDQSAARRLSLEQPDRFQDLIDILVDASSRYLIAQLRAGADVVKIFDSWAGVLDGDGFERWAVAPVRAMVERVRAAVPHARIIAFPKGAGVRLGQIASAVGPDALALDWTVPIGEARRLVPAATILQGNLDPLRLVLGGRALDEGVDAILEAVRGQPHIFNLGHGITPDTPIAHVERLVARVRAPSC
jgi:uroporphyrinogen decarboxylase